jgi:hypothetical protein
MKSKGLLLLMLMPFIGLAPGWALPRLATAMANGRVVGLPNGNIASLQVVLVSDGAPCAVLQTHTLADGSFRFPSVRAGNYRVAVIGLPKAYGIETMTAGNPIRVVSSSSIQILIEVARLQEIGVGRLMSCPWGTLCDHRA